MKRFAIMAFLIMTCITLFSAGYTVSQLCDSTSKYIVKASYPSFEGADFAKVNDDIKSVITTNFNTQVKEMKEMQKDEQLNVVPYSETTCSIFGYNDNFVSVLFYNETFTGGAHPGHTYFSYNYDFNIDGEVTLSDAGWPSSFLTKLADYCKKDITAQLVKKKVEDAESMVQEINPKYSSFNVFNVTTDGMYITFNEYVVAPYYIGALTVYVPDDEVEKMIK